MGVLLCLSVGAAVLRRHKVTLCFSARKPVQRTEWHSSFGLADAHKGLHCGLTVTVDAHV